MGTIANAKAAMHYQDTAPAPQQCQHCELAKHGHSRPDAVSFYSGLRCVRGGFFIHKLAGCQHWKAKAAEVENLLRK